MIEKYGLHSLGGWSKLKKHGNGKIVKQKRVRIRELMNSIKCGKGVKGWATINLRTKMS